MTTKKVTGKRAVSPLPNLENENNMSSWLKLKNEDNKERFKLTTGALIKDQVNNSLWCIKEWKVGEPNPEVGRLWVRKLEEWIEILKAGEGYSHQDRGNFYNIYLEYIFQMEKAKIFKTLLAANPIEPVDSLWERAQAAALILKEQKLLGLS